MTKCTNNTRLNRIGCGQEFSGELQHSVVKVSWSQYEDGRAHITASSSTINKCWSLNKEGKMSNPADLGFTQDERGIWRQPQSKNMLKWLKEINS